MPWHKVENHSECPAGKPWAVVKNDDGEVEGCHRSEKAANRQLAALNAVERSEPMSTTETEMGMGSDTFYRATSPSALIYRSDGETPTVEGMVVPYNVWTRVSSVFEGGDFLERFATGALKKTFSEGIQRMRGFFEHGQSPQFGRQAIMDITDLWETGEGAFFRANLLEGLPDLLINGLRRGLYGASIGARAVPGKSIIKRFPGKSAHNPEGIPEITRTEVRGFDISLTAVPVYGGSKVIMRSITDELAIEQLVKDPERLLQLLRQAKEAEPTHSEPTEPEAEVTAPAEDPEQTEEVEPETKPDEPEPEPEPEPEGSRATQPPKIDYLADDSEEDWRL